MRSGFATLATILAFFVGLVALPTIWAAISVANESGFVRMMSPLGKNSELREEAANAIGAEVAQRVPGADIIPQGKQLLQDTVSSQVQNLSGTTSFPQAWDTAVRATHHMLFATGSDAQDDTEPGAFALELEPFTAPIKEQIKEKTGITVPDFAEHYLTFADAEHFQDLRRLNITALAWWLGGATAVLVAVGIALSRRKTDAISWLGVGTAVVAGINLILFSVLGQFAMQRIPVDDALEPIKELIINTVLDNARSTFIIVLAAGVLLLGVGLFSRLLLAIKNGSVSRSTTSG